MTIQTLYVCVCVLLRKYGYTSNLVFPLLFTFIIFPCASLLICLLFGVFYAGICKKGILIYFFLLIYCGKVYNLLAENCIILYHLMILY